MAKTQILEYTIYLGDQALVDQFNAQIDASQGPGGLLIAFNPATGQFGPVGILRAPYNAATEGGAAVEFAIEAGIYPPALPIQHTSVPLDGPAVRSPWFGTQANFPIDVATFTRKSGGWFGISFLFGTTTKFYWVGRFAYAPPKDAVVDPETGEVVSQPAPIGARLMICGWELEGNDTGDGDGGQDTGQISSFQTDAEGSSRDSSRWPDGNGFCYRPGNSTSAHTQMQPLSTPALNHLWDRFYFRIRNLPTGARVIYEAENVATSGSGFRVYLLPDGSISCIAFPSASEQEPQFTTAPLAVNTWYRIDVLTQMWGTSGPPERRVGRLEWFVNGQNRGTGSMAPGGLTGNIKLAMTRVGTDVGATDVVGECDFDSWVSIVMPTDKRANTNEWDSGTAYSIGDRVQTTSLWGQAPSQTRAFIALTNNTGQNPETSPADWARITPGQDWLHGSRVVRVRPTAYSVNHDGSDWANAGTGALASDDAKMLDQYPGGALGSGTPHILTTVGGALAAVETDVAKVQALPGVLGAVAAIIAKFGTRGDTNGTLGGVATFDDLSTASVSQVLGIEGSSGSFRWNSIVLNLVDGTTEQLAKIIDALELRYTSAGTGNIRLNSFQALVEVIGIFGPEDQPAGHSEGLPPSAFVKGTHNGHYLDSPWGGGGVPPFAPATVHSGTYVSDGNLRYLTFPLPVHWIWIRRVAASAASPATWWPGMLAGHDVPDQRSDGYIWLNPERDPTFAGAGHEDEQEEQYRIGLKSADPQVNENGVTYQYVAICDPAKRYLLTGAVAHHEDSQVFPFTEALEEPTFTPEAAWTFPEGSSPTNTTRLAFKGPGHAAGAAHTVAGTALATYLDFAAGALLSQGNMFPANTHQTPYALFRNNDGNGAVPFVQIGSYVGNAVNPRTIALTPATGDRYPLFAAVMGNSNGIQRDPSHSGVGSTIMSTGGNTNTGITGGGIDSIIVNSSLNANAQTYHYFVIPGGTTPTADGFSENGDFFPVEPDTPTFDDQWQEPEEFTPEAGGGGEPVPGIGLDLDDDLADSVCVPFVHRVVNIALNRVGVNKPITALDTELSAEASLVREHYDESLHQTLRELPWPFATRYATLTLVAGAVGSPVNRDWTFSYRTPDDCVFPRRLVLTDRGESADAKGPPFIESSDASGGLILCNEASAQLEYTARIACPPAYGDATFRSAWAWLLASELAPALSRMADRAVHCIEMHRLTLQTARSFYKLGQPGLRPTAGTDPDANTLDEKLRVINIALARIGAQTLADLTIEQSREAILVALLYEDELRSCLRDFPWAFATRYVSEPAGTLTLVAGTLDTPAVPDWYFSFRAPTDMIFARRLVKSLDTVGVGRRFDPHPPRYRVGSDATGLLIYTNEEEPVLEYTIRPADVLRVADSLFRDAFAWRLSAALAPSLGRPDPEKEEQTGQAPKADDKAPKSENAKLQRQRLRQEQARWAWGMYLHTLDVAEASNSNEQQREDDGDASWIRDRN